MTHNKKYYHWVSCVYCEGTGLVEHQLTYSGFDNCQNCCGTGIDPDIREWLINKTAYSLSADSLCIKDDKTNVEFLLKFK